MSKEVPLTQGYVAVVDDEDFEAVSQFKWRAAVGPWGVYAATYFGGGRKNGRRGYMHRFLLGFPDGKVDHRNHNGLDNRRENLRPATDSQNQMNKRLNRTSKTGYKGVHFQEVSQKYMAHIRVNRKFQYLGLFATAEEAAAAYNAKAVELFGEFACLNEIRRVET